MRIFPDNLTTFKNISLVKKNRWDIFANLIQTLTSKARVLNPKSTEVQGRSTRKIYALFKFQYKIHHILKTKIHTKKLRNYKKNCQINAPFSCKLGTSYFLIGGTPGVSP